jgi:hypothetical protein
MKQVAFFSQIRQKLAIEKTSAFKTKISQMLGITESGAYKKINGITQLTLSEMNQICELMGIEMSFIENDQKDAVNHPFVFHCDDLIVSPQTYEQWASNILNHSLLLDRFKPDYKVISFQSEISYFHLLPFKSLLFFKLYAWNRSSWKIPSPKKFSLTEFRKNYALNSLLDKAYEHYVSYKSIEIWHIDFIDGVLSQLKYYYQLNIFENKDDLLSIVKEIKKLVLHLEGISREGKKKIFGKKESNSPIDIFINYTHTSSSVMYIESSQFRMIYNLFLHPNYIRSQDEYVCDYTEQWLNKTIGQSELISGSGELIRENFFRDITEKIVNLENELNINSHK